MSAPATVQDQPTAARHSAPQSIASSAASARPRQILLIDDDDSVRSTLADVLIAEGYQVFGAGDARSALARFRTDPPDLVLLDLSLLGADGWDLFDDMERARPFIPCIVITARPDQGRRASLVGADALMEKPLNLPLLLAVIQRLFAETETERVSRLVKRSYASATFRVLHRLPVARHPPKASDTGA